MARLESTSFMFMLDWVPEPVCQTTRGNSSSNLPWTTSAAAVEMASAKLVVEFAQILVHEGRGLLDERESVHERGRHSLSADAEILDGTLGLGAPELVGGDFDGAEGICFGAS